MHIHIFIQSQLVTKEAKSLKELGEGYRAGFGEKEGKEEVLKLI